MNNDYFVLVGSPGSATSITSPGHSTGGTTLKVASTANFPPVGNSVIFAIDTFTNQTLNGQTVQVRDTGSYTEWEAVVTDSTTLSNMVIRYGSDQPYLSTTLTRVYIPVSSSRENRLVAGILQQHNQQGGHTNVTATTVNTTAAITSGGLITATNGLNVSGGPTNLPNNAITAPMLDTAAITLGYAQITSTFSGASTSALQITGLTSTVTIPAGGRRVKITVYCYGIYCNTATSGYGISLWDGPVETGTQLQATQLNNSLGSGTSANMTVPNTLISVISPAAGTKTYNVGLYAASGTVFVQAQTGAPSFILVETI